MYFVIYDFETTGRSSRFDQILQAGLICFDSSLKEIQRLNLRSRINPDIVPSLGALKVNKLLMTDLLEEKNSSYEMMRDLNDFLNHYKPSIFLGYNSIHFDEEFLRQSLWEFFKYPYITSTKENCRGDVFNLATMTHAFDSNAVNVDKNNDGKMSFKLESLASINNIKIDNAHEAISDVLATKKVLEIIKNSSPKLFSNFLENTKVKKIGEKIKTSEFFTYYGYYFNKHYIYLLTQLLDHPTYNNYILAFDLKFDPEEIINLEYNELVSVYYEKKLNGKSFNCFKKIKLNKQPAVLDFNYSINRSPYNEIGLEELKKRKDKIKNEEFLGNFKKILITESENYETNYEFEEETIYSEGINFSDKIIMEDFDKVEWEKKWDFASKFKDPRLLFFAARHIYRNTPEFLPNNIFRRVHQKISERFNSMKKEKFTTIPSAMEEADTLSAEIEEGGERVFIIKQLEQYNIYINFLNSYYNDINAKPLKFDNDLSKKLFYQN